MGEKYSVEEINYLKDNYLTKTNEELREGLFKLNKSMGREVDRSRHVICKMLRILELKRPENVSKGFKNKIKKQAQKKWDDIDNKLKLKQDVKRNERILHSKQGMRTFYGVNYEYNN